MSDASGSRVRSEWALRSASPAEATSRTSSIAATSASSAGSAAASGQSARCTDRSPVSPRQTSSVTSGISGAVTRHTVSRTVQRVSKALDAPCPSESQNRSRERRMYQLVSTSRKVRVASQAAATS